MATSPYHHAHYVYFNDGTNQDVFALVIGDNGGGNLNLFTIPGSGAPQTVDGIPHREVKDYGPEGGGDTWHL